MLSAHDAAVENHGAYLRSCFEKIPSMHVTRNSLQSFDVLRILAPLVRSRATCAQPFRLVSPVVQRRGAIHILKCMELVRHSFAVATRLHSVTVSEVYIRQVLQCTNSPQIVDICPLPGLPFPIIKLIEPLAAGRKRGRHIADRWVVTCLEIFAKDLLVQCLVRAVVQQRSQWVASAGTLTHLGCASACESVLFVGHHKKCNKLDKTTTTYCRSRTMTQQRASAASSLDNVGCRSCC